MAHLRLLAVAALGAACIGSSPRYVVTAEPVQVGRGIEQCIALELGRIERAWWWGPGRSGCATRNTGPDLFLLEDARITHDADRGAMTVSYSLPLIPAGELPVVLVVQGTTVQPAGVGWPVELEPASTLDVPELPGFLP